MNTPIRGLIAAAALAGAAFAAQAAPFFTSLTIFGDSLSDSGNNALVIGSNGGQVISGNAYIPNQPYAFGAYTNNQVWVNSFATGLGLPTGAVPSGGGGSNYAYGGARTTINGQLFGFPPSASTQLAQYLAVPGALPATALYVIAIGGNDARDTGNAVAANPGNAASIIGSGAASFASGVGAMVDSLQARGAQNIVVWNLPNVGASPAALATGPVGAATATLISQSFNGALAARMTGEAGVQVFDLYGLVSGVVANPGAYGLTNVVDACGAIAGCNPSQYLFWDGIHPTSAGHAIISNAMLAAVPEPGAVWLMLVGAVALFARGRVASQRRA